MKVRFLLMLLLLVFIGCSSSSTTDPGGGDDGSTTPPPDDGWSYGTVALSSVTGYFSEFYSNQFSVLMQDWGDENGIGLSFFYWYCSEWDEDLIICFPFDAGDAPALPVTLNMYPGEDYDVPDGQFWVRGTMDWPSEANGFYGLEGTFTIYEMNYQERRFRGSFNFRMAALAFDYDAGYGWNQVGGSYYESGFVGEYDYPYVVATLSEKRPILNQRD